MPRLAVADAHVKESVGFTTAPTALLHSAMYELQSVSFRHTVDEVSSLKPGVSLGLRLGHAQAYILSRVRPQDPKQLEQLLISKVS